VLAYSQRNPLFEYARCVSIKLQVQETMCNKLYRAVEVLFVAAVCIAHIEMYVHLEPDKASGAGLFAGSVFTMYLLRADRKKQKQQNTPL